jgi:mono/diheme cytochrome c family protein
MNRVRVALFADRSAAEPIRERLQQSGIPAEIRHESWLARLWFVSRLSAGVRVEVPAALADRADELLEAWDAAQEISRSAIRCRECGSLRVDYPQFTEKSLLTNLAIGLFAGLGLVEKDYYCEQCHNMWPKPSKTPRRVRAHQAPNYFIEGLPGSETQATTMPEPATADLPPHDDSKGRRGKSGSKAIKPAHSIPLAMHKDPAGLASPLIALMLLLGSGVFLLASDTRGLPVDPAPETAVSGSGAEGKPARLVSPTYFGDVLPILMGKCARCHSQSTILQNWLDYKSAYGDRWEIRRRVWLSWRGSYFKQPMPTGNSPESQAMTEEERQIIKSWVENGAPRGVPTTQSGLQSKDQRIEQGKRLFNTICAACHQPTGLGIPGRFPPLAGSDFLNSDKQRAIRIVLNGLQGEITVRAQKFNNSMPKLPLSDEEIACALTFVYNSFGNSGKDVMAEEVAAARSEGEEPVVAGKIQTAKVPQEKSPFE